MKMIFPDYKNNIVNVASTLAHYLGKHNGIQRIEVLEQELKLEYKNVIFIVIDGLGSRIMEKHLPEKSFLRQSNKQTITSVFPSTTTNATKSLISASYPAEHGWFGWAMNFDDKTVELFRNTDYYSKEKLLDDNFVSKQLPYEVFFENPLNDIKTYDLMPSGFKNGANNNCVTFNTASELFKKINTLCDINKRKFVYCYYNELDDIMHEFGPSSRQAKKTIRKLDRKFKSLVDKNFNSLFIITADHGQIDVSGYIEIYKDQDIINCLDKNFSLEQRATAFHVKKGKDQEFKNSFKKYEIDFALFETTDLIKKGVFGNFKNEVLKEFLGNYIAVGNETNKIFLFKEVIKRKKGHHTGLTENEMLVPLIIAKNDTVLTKL